MENFELWADDLDGEPKMALCNLTHEEAQEELESFSARGRKAVIVEVPEDQETLLHQGSILVGNYEKAEPDKGTVEGDSYSKKEELKALGATFSGSIRKWIVSIEKTAEVEALGLSVKPIERKKFTKTAEYKF